MPIDAWRFGPALVLALLLGPSAVEAQPAPAGAPARQGPILLTPPVFGEPSSPQAAPQPAGLPVEPPAPVQQPPAAPVVLQPTDSPQGDSQPVQTGPGPVPDTVPPPAAEPAISTTVLNALDPASIGLFDAAGALGSGLWQGLDRPFVAGVLQRLPAPVASPTLRGLVRRLLVTQAEIPAAVPNGFDLLQTKLDRLHAAGDAADLAAMAEVAPVGAGTPDGLRARLLDGLIVAAPDTRLCPLARAWAGQGDDRALAVEIACRALGADPDGARLGLALLAEHKAVAPAFNALVTAALGGDKPKVADIPADDVLLLFMATRLNIALSAETIRAAPLIAAPLVLAAKGPVAARAEAIERAAAAGVLDANALAGLYRIIGALSPANRPSGEVTVRAMAWKDFDEASGPAVRAQAMAAFLSIARPVLGSAAAAGVVSGALGSLSDAGLPPALAARLVRLALAADDDDSAIAQYAQLRRRPAAPELSRLWPYEAVSLNPLGGLPDGVDDFVRGLGSAPPATRQKALVAAVLRGLGLDLPAALGAAGAVDPFALPAGLVERLDGAVAGGRSGEALGLAVAMLGATPLSQVDPAVLAKALATIKGLGLDLQARRLAVEVLLDAGL